jgi:hypothetical protein
MKGDKYKSNLKKLKEMSIEINSQKKTKEL